ncbi:hypothetical protein PTMSG1_02604 [Pyrenophora teres f. maculata]|nr:hypothetical protein PTMSG1_02604 [Pyrenophora teres f. maculata]
MLFWVTLLAWLAAYVGFGSAAPVEQSVNNTIVSALDVYPYSLQIHLMQVENWRHAVYEWHIFQGPSGIGVYPCGDKAFKKVYKSEPFSNTKEDLLDYPPYPAGIDIKIKYSNRKNCAYHAGGEDAGQFHCGDEYIIDCKLDPHFGQQYKCSDYMASRAWFCNF